MGRVEHKCYRPLSQRTGRDYDKFDSKKVGSIGGSREIDDDDKYSILRQVICASCKESTSCLQVREIHGIKICEECEDGAMGELVYRELKKRIK